jgi:HlyD family type I secretion membrane fusion protein
MVPASLPPDRHTLRSPILLGLVAIFAAIGGIGTWSATAPISSVVVAPGKVAVATKRKEIQHLDGGIVKTIHIRDYDEVKQGAVLLELDDTKAKAHYVLARAAYFAAAITYARLAAERDGADEIKFSAEILAEAQRSTDIRKGIDTQRQVFDSRARELAGQIKVWLQRIAQLKDEIAGLTAERAAASEQSSLAGKEATVIENMFERGFVTRQRVHSIRRESAQLAGSLGRLDAGVAKARKEIGETELSIQQLALRRQSEILTEMKDLEQRIFDLKEQYLAAADELTRLVVTAPVSGIVVNSQVHTVGGVIRPGLTVLEIVPGTDPLIVEARVRPLDIDELAKGQATEVRFPGFKQRTTPSLSGTVAHVAADAVTDPRTGEAYYTAVVSIPHSEIERLGHQLQPGMPAEVLIKTGNRSAIAYFVQPLTDGMNRALREQ